MTTMHKDCIACLADGCKDQRGAVLAAVSTIKGLGFEKVYSDLCFLHRRIVDNACKHTKELFE